MLWCLGFESVAVVAADIYFQDPGARPGQEGAERGVRLEGRLLERHDRRGDVHSAVPIGLGAPVWRADFLETVDGPPGSFDRTHHHPEMRGWDVGHRAFDEDMTSDPLAWLARQLGDLDALFDQAGVDGGHLHREDA